MKIGFFEKINKQTGTVEKSLGRLVIFMIAVGGLSLIITGIVGFFLDKEIGIVLGTSATILVSGVLGKAAQNKSEIGEK